MDGGEGYSSAGLAAKARREEGVARTGVVRKSPLIATSP